MESEVIDRVLELGSIICFGLSVITFLMFAERENLKR